MDQTLQAIVNNICYTELVYGRINKKLKISLSKSEIEALVMESIKNADKVERIGKNYYIYSSNANIRITVNANNYRVITTDLLID